MIDSLPQDWPRHVTTFSPYLFSASELLGYLDAKRYLHNEAIKPAMMRPMHGQNVKYAKTNGIRFTKSQTGKKDDEK